MAYVLHGELANVNGRLNTSNFDKMKNFLGKLYRQIGGYLRFPILLTKYASVVDDNVQAAEMIQAADDGVLQVGVGSDVDAVEQYFVGAVFFRKFFKSFFSMLNFKF